MPYTQVKCKEGARYVIFVPFRNVIFIHFFGVKTRIEGRMEVEYRENALLDKKHLIYDFQPVTVYMIYMALL